MNNKNLTHFRTLFSCKDENTKKYANLILKLIEEFENDFTTSKKCMKLEILSSPFSLIPDNV